MNYTPYDVCASSIIAPLLHTGVVDSCLIGHARPFKKSIKPEHGHRGPYDHDQKIMIVFFKFKIRHVAQLNFHLNEEDQKKN